jgi:RHS repeat-associated protein
MRLVQNRYPRSKELRAALERLLAHLRGNVDVVALMRFCNGIVIAISTSARWLVLSSILTLLCVSAASAANSPPAMITPGQFNVGATGTFSYTIPIAVPPGTGGMVPALSLDYSSQNGDGLEGLGWTLSGVPSIGRCPRTIAQDALHGGVNYNTSDRFCMEGQRLVAISGSYGADGTIYRTEIDGFSKIISHGTSGAGPAYFEVHTKAGQIIYFGWDEDTVNASNNSRLTLSPSNLTARAWAVEKIADTKGNYLIVKYTNDMTNGQAYPNEIDYTGNAGASLTPYASVKFAYESRSDVIPMYQAGYLQQTTQLLSNIETYYGTTLVSNYKLAYTLATDNTQHDELTSVTQCDSLTGGNCLKPTTFGWQGSKSALSLSSADVSSYSQGIASDLGTITPSDFNGDGLTDFLANNDGNTSTGCNIFLGTSTGNTFTTGILTSYTQWSHDDGGYYHVPVVNGIPCYGTGFPISKRFPDVNGDGIADLILSQAVALNTINAFILLNTGGHLNQITTFNAGSQLQWILGDFDGDGRADLLENSPVLGSNWSTQFGDGAGNFGTSLWAPTLSLATGPTLTLADFDGDGCTDILQQGSTNNITYACNPAVASALVTNWTGSALILGDFNGDGKTDILVIPNSGNPTLYLSTGTGLDSGHVISSATDWHKYQIIVGDWNGDGKADIALIAAGISGGYGVGTSHKFYLSTGTGFVAATDGSGTQITIANTNPADTKELATAADWNNDGATDAWLKKPSGDTEYEFAYVPELIHTVTNGLGITTTVTYDRINKNGIFYAKGTSASYPMQDVDGPLYAVSEIDSSNSISGTYSSTYSYAGAQFNLQGRGFSGFAQLTIKDLQTGIVQTTNYETVWPYLGLIASQTKVCPAPTCATAVTLNSTTNAFETVSLGTGTDGVARSFVGLHQSVVASNDLNGAAMPSVTTTYTYDCDTGSTSICAGTSPTGFGNATVVAQSVSDGSSKTTTNTFTNDATNWYLGRLTAASVHSIVGSSNLTRQTSFGYDPTSGLLISEIVEPETSSDTTLKLETDYGYDAFGNKTSATTKGCVWVSSSSCSTTTGTATRQTTTLFDATTYHGQFATQITNALSQSESWAYTATNNVAFELPSGHTGPNGLTTSWIYDTFGRKTLETRPDDNKTAIAYTYCTGLPTGESCPTNAQFDTIVTPENPSGAQNGPISVTYYDGLSRAIATDAEGFDATGTGCTATAPCWIRVATQFDANGRVAQTSRPYFLSGGTAKWTVLTYDTIGRVTKATFPDASKTQFGFNGLTTTVTNDKSQVTTTVMNAQGLNASVEDANSKTTSYVYDAFGDLLTVTDPSSNVTTNTYDIRGRKKTAADPDMGNWSYVYDGFGELYSQTDAKSQITTLTYDALGRTLTRSEPGLTSTWVYDTASGKGIGQLASATTGSGYTRTYTYDTLGRPSTVTLTVSGTAHTYTETYDANGRLSTVAYPSGFTAKDTNTALGYLYTVSDNSLGTVFFTAKTRDAELHLLTQTAGNGLTTTDAFDPNTGRPLSILAGTGNDVSNQTFAFDTLGNLTSRTWLNNAGVSMKENACYDSLNRLTNSLVTTGTACTGSGSVTIAFDALGNITSKSDICTAANCFGYGAGSAGPHALTSISGTYNGVANPTFAYDANGNMSSGAGRGVTSTSFNMAASITDGSSSDTLTYDPEHSRITQVATGTNAGTTVYLNDPVSGAMEEAFTASSALTYRDYIMADGHMVALRSLGLSSPPVWGTPAWDSFPWTAQSTTPVLLYFTLDHLGSISVVTDAGGAIVERDSYDAWGLRRNPDGTAANCGAVTSATSRGFTGQEMMDNVCFINFNARVYDPALGRFMSADPTTETVYNLQVLNRYSYVGNDPLSLTDPTGLCFLGCFWHSSIFRAILDIALIFILPELEGLQFAELTDLATSIQSISAIGLLAINAGIAGGIAAAVAGGNILQGAEFGALQAGLTFGVGGALGSVLGSSIPAEFVAQGITGGLASVAEGGNFGSGFLAGGVGSLAGPLTGGSPGQFSPQGVLESAVLGGASSVLGGGKFANGAITGAFSYAASSVGQGDAASDNDTSNDNAPATNTSPSTQTNSGSSSDPLVSAVNNQMGAPPSNDDIEDVIVTGTRDPLVLAANDNIPTNWSQYTRRAACTAASYECHSDAPPGKSGQCLLAEIGCNATALGAKATQPGVTYTGHFPNGRIVIIPSGPAGEPYWGPPGPPDWDNEKYTNPNPK